MYGYSAAPGFAIVSPTLTSINVTQPGTGGSYARNSTLNVGWTPNAAVNVGEFGIWIRSSAANWYFQKTVPRPVCRRTRTRSR